MKRVFKSRDEILVLRYKRLFIASAVLCVLFLSMLVFVVFTNYNYIVFKYLLADHYAYPETLDKVFYSTIRKDDVKNYKKNFDEMVIDIVLEKIRETDGDRYTFLYTPEYYEVSEQATKTDALETEFKELTKETVYLRIPNVSSYSKKYIIDNKEAINKYDNIIIDLRANYGGSLDALYDLSDMFLEKGAIIGYENARTSFFSKKIKSSKAQYFKFDKIILLQDSGTASAAEGFIMSLKENLGNVTVVGTQSFGKGIGQISFPLKGGFVANMTVITISTPNGNSIHKVGITPDVFYNADDIVEYALTLIN